MPFGLGILLRENCIQNTVQEIKYNCYLMKEGHIAIHPSWIKPDLFRLQQKLGIVRNNKNFTQSIYIPKHLDPTNGFLVVDRLNVTDGTHSFAIGNRLVVCIPGQDFSCLYPRFEKVRGRSKISFAKLTDEYSHRKIISYKEMECDIDHNRMESGRSFVNLDPADDEEEYGDDEEKWFYQFENKMVNFSHFIAAISEGRDWISDIFDDLDFDCKSPIIDGMASEITLTLNRLQVNSLLSAAAGNRLGDSFMNVSSFKDFCSKFPEYCIAKSAVAIDVGELDHEYSQDIRSKYLLSFKRYSHLYDKDTNTLYVSRIVFDNLLSTGIFFDEFVEAKCERLSAEQTSGVVEGSIGIVPADHSTEQGAAAANHGSSAS